MQRLSQYNWNNVKYGVKLHTINPLISHTELRKSALNSEWPTLSEITVVKDAESDSKLHEIDLIQHKSLQINDKTASVPRARWQISAENRFLFVNR